jgi:hypothetical protein
MLCWPALVGTSKPCRGADPPAAQSADQATARHARVAERRSRIHIICHRGASEFAHENTLEAYRATFELGADGNEIDIRATKDGVLICFHDDMLDRLLFGYGDVSDYSWDELQRLSFREPGPFAEQCRIPTLTEVLELHRQHGGLLHLDIKRPNLDRAIVELLDRFDMWDSVAYCNPDTGGVILTNPRLKLCKYKAGLYQDRSEVFPEAIATALKRPGDGLIVDDPRGALVALERKLGAVSASPVAPRAISRTKTDDTRSETELVSALRDAADWNVVGQGDEERLAAGRRIVARAQAADQLAAKRSASEDVFIALEERVRERSLHRDWMYHGVDGASALRSLILLRAPNAVATARFVLWREDPALAAVRDHRYQNPLAWTDFRVKMVVFPALAHFPGAPTERLCRDYLALTDTEAQQLGPSQFEEAARTLLSANPSEAMAAELMKHRLQVVRGRVVLECLRRSNEDWARSAIQRIAPWASGYLVPKTSDK